MDPGGPGVYSDKAKYSPTNVAFGPDGGFYIGDGYGSSYIHQYDKHANWVRTWGGFGDAPGKMKTPHGLWLDNRPGREPSLVVADRANARLQYFTLDGKHLGYVHEVSFPAHFDLRGEVMMVPDLHARVSLFDPANKVIAHLGYDPAWTKQVLADGFKMRRTPNGGRPGNSSIRTTPASTRPEISSSSNGCRQAVFRSCGKSAELQPVAETANRVNAPHDAPMLHSTSSVKGGPGATRFFCGGFLLLCRRKHRKIGKTVQKLELLSIVVFGVRLGGVLQRPSMNSSFEEMEDLLVPLRRRQRFSAAGQLEHHRQARSSRAAPFVRRWRKRIVANVDSIGFVVRRCFQCSAGKS